MSGSINIETRIELEWSSFTISFKNEKLNKNNTREYALTLAYYYQIMGDGVKEAEQLEIAYPLIKKKDFKSELLKIKDSLILISSGSNPGARILKTLKIEPTHWKWRLTTKQWTIELITSMDPI